MIKIAKAVWVGISVLVLFITLYAFDGKPNSDIEIFLVWYMFSLAFPSGLLYALLFSGISILLDNYFSITLYTTYLSLTLSWLGLFVLGYLQWFKLLPWLVEKWRARRAAQT